ncbi:tyrosine-protein phosphatase [Sedimentitalea sp.]|uniref:tyrosine-protein phosphatase n=1 Tax=Sedimentitalea sp. TaxID=2048915 RepID=UPI0032998174
MRYTRHMPVQGAYNIRDLGGYVTGSGSMTPWRRFLRSDSLHRIAAGETDRLHSEGVRAVIDLRTTSEVADAPNPFAAYPGVHFANLPLFADLSPVALSNADARTEHPLLSFYMSALETRGTAICSILGEIAAVDHGAVLFNCTAGKDRTGIIAALLLGVAEVPRNQIISDYTLTAEFIPDLVAEFLDLSRARGGDTKNYARLLESPASTMAGILEHIGIRYGTVSNYLQEIGLPRSDYRTLHNRLIGEGQ